MPTRLISWQQLVLENDPDWVRGSLNPLVWEFSNGRLFSDPPQVYAPLPDSGLALDGNFIIIDGAELALSSVDTGVPGALFLNDNFICTSKSTVYQRGLSLYYPCTLDQLMLLGGIAWPPSAGAGSGQIFNNGGFACVA